MKKLILSTTLVAIFGFANAQTEQGAILVGASSNLGFTSTSVDGVDDNASNFNLDARGGYFVIDNLAVGLGLGFNNQKQGDNKIGTTSFGLFGRYYVNGTFFLGAGFDTTKTTLETAAGSGDVSGSFINFEAGYPVWLGDNAAIEPSLNYSIGGGDANDGTNVFGLAVGFSLYF
ncbi:MAG: hypothetical protein AB8B73_01780 [Ekhidna sp.]